LDEWLTVRTAVPVENSMDTAWNRKDIWSERMTSVSSDKPPAGLMQLPEEVVAVSDAQKAE
jgi:hypothetical protein